MSDTLPPAVAIRHSFDGHGWLYLDNGWGSNWETRIADGERLYAEEDVRRIISVCEAAESLRPLWAMGYTNDSLAAQSTGAALSQLWGLLGVKNQTDAVKRLKMLLDLEGP